MLQGEGVSIEEKARGSRGPSLSLRVLTNQSFDAFFVTRLVTLRRITQIKVAMVVLRSSCGGIR